MLGCGFGVEERQQARVAQSKVSRECSWAQEQAVLPLTAAGSIVDMAWPLAVPRRLLAPPALAVPPRTSAKSWRSPATSPAAEQEKMRGSGPSSSALQAKNQEYPFNSLT